MCYTVDVLPNAGTELEATLTSQWFVSPQYPAVVPTGLREVWYISTGTSAPVSLRVGGNIVISLNVFYLCR